MRGENSEAPTSCDSQGFVLSATLSESTDMKSIANNQLTFHSTTFSYMEIAGQIWLTAAEVGQALEYADDKAIHRIFNRHSDEFTTQMTGVVRATTPGGMQDVRVFSLRGAHLIGMFARTAKAKEFRRWVLDILDREVQQGNAHPAFDFEIALHNARGVNIHLRAIKEMWRDGLEEALKLMEHKNRGSISERLRDMTFFSSPLEISLNQHSKKKKIH
ncbi:BRO family%2C N-terminal domain [Yersinia nurmii]|uniref:BRO family, N-terminal domain n=1 Tax=Yersinia nurmii TaxID=685706 RepID=A0ABM9SMU4_9GAMM|nr:Bro-N domain-containing protein [Yersinia nurmii]CNF26814.1 BRO family%2C N-terminal domain [Yersinia nurmii]